MQFFSYLIYAPYISSQIIYLENKNFCGFNYYSVSFDFINKKKSKKKNNKKRTKRYCYLFFFFFMNVHAPDAKFGLVEKRGMKSYSGGSTPLGEKVRYRDIAGCTKLALYARMSTYACFEYLQRSRCSGNLIPKHLTGQSSVDLSLWIV